MKRLRCRTLLLVEIPLLLVENLLDENSRHQSTDSTLDTIVVTLRTLHTPSTFNCLATIEPDLPSAYDDSKEVLLPAWLA